MKRLAEELENLLRCGRCGSDNVEIILKQREEGIGWELNTYIRKCHECGCREKLTEYQEW